MARPKRLSILTLLTLSLAAGSALAQDDFGTTDTADPMAAPATENPPSMGTTDTSATEGSSSGMGTEAGTMGLSFVVPTGGAPTVGLTYFLDPMAALRVDVGFALTSLDNGMDRDTDFGFSIEAGYRMYRNVVDKLAVYLQPSLFISEATGDADFADLLTVGVTGAFGAEYWFSNHWSLGGSIGGALLFSNSFKNVSLTTGTSSLFTSFYW